MHGQAMLNAHNHDQSYATASQSQSHPYLLSPVLFYTIPILRIFIWRIFIYLLLLLLLLLFLFKSYLLHDPPSIRTRVQ